MFEAIYNEFAGTFSAVPFGVSATPLTSAAVLGAVIGFERGCRAKPAGLRTNILVALAACLFVIAGIELTQLEFGDRSSQRADPLRLIEAVTAGVAFLAAGIIFTSQGKVRNITTGASLWMAGAIGLACGASQIPLATMTAIFVVIILVAARQFERVWGTYDSEDGPAGPGDKSGCDVTRQRHSR